MIPKNIMQNLSNPNENIQKLYILLNIGAIK